MNYKKRQRIFDAKIAPEYEQVYYFICSQVNGDRELAKDITQDAMELMWHKLDQLQNVDSIRSWIFSIAKNETRKYFRSQLAQKRSLFSEQSMDDPEQAWDISDESQPDILDVIIAREEQDMLMKCLSQIADPYRSILELRYIQSLSYPEIGEILELSEATARVYCQRAIKKLEKEYCKLAGQGEEEDK